LKLTLSFSLFVLTAFEILEELFNAVVALVATFQVLLHENLEELAELNFTGLVVVDLINDALDFVSVVYKSECDKGVFQLVNSDRG